MFTWFEADREQRIASLMHAIDRNAVEGRLKLSNETGRLSDEDFDLKRRALATAIVDATSAQGAQQTAQKALDAAFIHASGVQSLAAWSSMVQKDITSTSPLNTSAFGNYGLMPFDLEAPAMMLYPVLSPLRQRIPRGRGQGSNFTGKRVLGISGSQTGGAAFVNPFVPELPQAQTMSGNYPLTFQNPIAMVADSIHVPYKIMQLSNNVSFLAQFEGEGYQDIAGLATLQLMQAMMIGEEYALTSARSTVLGTPGTPSVTVRTTGTGETDLAAGTVAVRYTANNLFGETVAGGTALGTITAGHVLDVTLPDVTGAEFYKVYAGLTGNTLFNAGQTAWNKFTLFGALPTAGGIPAADTGTGNSNNYDGLISILSGSANSVYDPSSLGVNSGYTKRHNAGASGSAAFTYSDVQDAFQAMYTKNKARLDEVWFYNTDRRALSEQIIQAGAAVAAYRIMTNPDQAGNLRVGAVVSSIVNESVGNEVAFQVHPWLPQGNALLLSWTLPFPNTEVPNPWEVRGPQDMLSIAWPVIDPAFRYSIFQYNALIGRAPQFSGLIQGIPAHATTPYS